MAHPIGPHNPIKQAASSIIGEDLKPTTPAMPEDLSAAQPAKHSFHRISVKPQGDGSILVQHTPKRESKPGEPGMGSMDDYDNEVSTSHATPAAAHAHLGKLMGVGAVAPTTKSAPETAAGASGAKVPLAK